VIPFAHAGHVLVDLLYAVPLVRERRARGKRPDL
jgi:hypothetical protein